ncbi:MAG: hypothetical protein WBH86_04635, partial [Thermogutta sp.]
KNGSMSPLGALSADGSNENGQCEMAAGRSDKPPRKSNRAGLPGAGRPIEWKLALDDKRPKKLRKGWD